MPTYLVKARVVAVTTYKVEASNPDVARRMVLPNPHNHRPGPPDGVSLQGTKRESVNVVEVTEVEAASEGSNA